MQHHASPVTCFICLGVLRRVVFAYRDAPLTGAQLGSQLSALGSKHRHVQDPHTAQQLARMVPVVYGALGELPGPELAAAAAVLEGQPSVWVGNGFVAASRVAFKVGDTLRVSWCAMGCTCLAVAYVCCLVHGRAGCASPALTQFMQGVFVAC